MAPCPVSSGRSRARIWPGAGSCRHPAAPRRRRRGAVRAGRRAGSALLPTAPGRLDPPAALSRADLPAALSRAGHHQRGAAGMRGDVAGQYRVGGILHRLDREGDPPVWPVLRREGSEEAGQQRPGAAHRDQHQDGRRRLGPGLRPAQQPQRDGAGEGRRPRQDQPGRDQPRAHDSHPAPRVVASLPPPVAIAQGRAAPGFAPRHRRRHPPAETGGPGDGRIRSGGARRRGGDRFRHGALRHRHPRRPHRSPCRPHRGRRGDARCRRPAGAARRRRQPLPYRGALPRRLCQHRRHPAGHGERGELRQRQHLGLRRRDDVGGAASCRSGRARASCRALADYEQRAAKGMLDYSFHQIITDPTRRRCWSARCR